jgi:hypothetical protein
LDLSILAEPRNHQLVVAGDWNILRGYGDDESEYWKARYETVFERAEALGLVAGRPRIPGPSGGDDPPPMGRPSTTASTT